MEVIPFEHNCAEHSTSMFNLILLRYESCRTYLLQNGKASILALLLLLRRPRTLTYLRET